MLNILQNILCCYFFSVLAQNIYIYKKFTHLQNLFYIKLDVVIWFYKNFGNQNIYIYWNYMTKITASGINHKFFIIIKQSKSPKIHVWMIFFCCVDKNRRKKLEIIGDWNILIKKVNFETWLWAKKVDFSHFECWHETWLLNLYFFF